MSNHQVHSLKASDDGFKKFSPLSYLIDARLSDGKLLKRDGVNIFFSDTNKAAQFLARGQNPNAVFTAQPVHADSFMTLAKVTVDPCAHCDFKTVLDVKTFKTKEELSNSISRVLAEQFHRTQSVLSNAHNEIENGRFKEAAAMAQVGIDHCSPAFADFHFVLAICGKQIGDIMMEKLARQNLEKHAPEMLLKLKK